MPFLPPSFVHFWFCHSSGIDRDILHQKNKNYNSAPLWLKGLYLILCVVVGVGMFGGVAISYGICGSSKLVRAKKNPKITANQNKLCILIVNKM